MFIVQYLLQLALYIVHGGYESFMYKGPGGGRGNETNTVFSNRMILERGVCRKYSYTRLQKVFDTQN